MAEVYLFMADGTEECEALLVLDLLRRAEIDVKTVSIKDVQEILSSHGVRLYCDLVFSDIDPNDGRMLVLPGGLPGTLNLRDHAGLSALIDDYANDGRWLAAICAAPSILGGKGLLDGESATSAPGFKDKLGTACYTGRPVEVLQRPIVTGKGLGASIPFSLKLIQILRDKATATAVAEKICYDGEF